MSALGNWVNGNDASVCSDESDHAIWNQWGANQRDLFVLDHTGNVVLYQNIGRFWINVLGKRNFYQTPNLSP